MALQILDDAIQAHGGGGVSQDFGPAHAWAAMWTLRFADGPDEVHNRAIARHEFGKYAEFIAAVAAKAKARREAADSGPRSSRACTSNGLYQTNGCRQGCVRGGRAVRVRLMAHCVK